MVLFFHVLQLQRGSPYIRSLGPDSDLYVTDVNLWSQNKVNLDFHLSKQDRLSSACEGTGASYTRYGHFNFTLASAPQLFVYSRLSLILHLDL